MQLEFTKLRLALADPADGPYALVEKRNLLINALKNWPNECYPIADLLLPHGKPVSQESRRVIDGLISILEIQPNRPDEILDLVGGLRLVCW
ncbi:MULTISPECIES: hypothetical protein [Pseudomonas]|uniref:Uncharacterized protein n=2 Tax=Pseudomonas TaxID=286 RepID=A0A449IRD0_PSEFR|nr:MULTISPECIES: hypothetical protein [Pseudomonas]MDN5391397.1 hypothetical protein [Pseudomonas sp.]MDN5406905.1 hypothetical protein [Pseudomonas sp.]MDN5453922.1 hypothetical protein [Pseudomonas sp.]MDN5457213.1 hypothetical protein [Pseudomonas sp.]MDN5670943.1 hypothetical protein [Pseudomonas sp.]